MTEEDRLEFALIEGENRFLNSQIQDETESDDNWQDEIVDYEK
jgi:hypothetical protein